MIIASGNENNYLDNNTNIKASATLYSPSVVLAINRNAQRLHHWSEDEYRRRTEELLWGTLGLYVDWKKNGLIDSRGNYFTDVSQLDSIYFLLTLENKAWPCDPVHLVTSSGIISLFGLDVGCYVPDISRVEDQITLTNDEGATLLPRNVWGRRSNLLTLEETMFVVFRVREKGAATFLKNTNSIVLRIRGFETNINLNFPVTQLRQLVIN